VDAGAGCGHDVGASDLSPPFVGHPYHVALRHAVDAGDERLDLDGQNQLAAALVHVLGAPGELEVAVGVDVSEVTGTEPAVGADGFDPLAVPEPLGDDRSTPHQLARSADRKVLAGIGVHDPELADAPAGRRDAACAAHLHAPHHRGQAIN